MKTNSNIKNMSSSTGNMKTNSSTKKMFRYIVKGEKAKYIWEYSVPLRGLMIVGVASLLIGIIFKELFDHTTYFLLHTAIKIALCIPVAAISGKLSFEAFADIVATGHWTKATVWKYIIGEGIFGYGLICFIVIGQFIPFIPAYIVPQILIWSGLGLIIGIWTRVSWKVGKIKDILLELKAEGVV